MRGSDGSRVYRVYVDPGRGLVYSDDNGTRLRGYVGYPVIAALMDMGVLPWDPAAAEALRGIPWRRLNEEMKRYALVMEHALRVAEQRGYPRTRLLALVDEVMRRLRGLELRMLEQPPLELAGTVDKGAGDERA